MQKHDTLLIACANPEHRSLLRLALQERFNLLETANVSQTLLLLEANANCVAGLVLTTSVIGSLEKNQLMEPRVKTLLETIPIIIVTEDDTLSQPNLFFQYGAADVIPLDYDPYAMLRRIEALTQLHVYKQHLETMIQEQADTLRHTNDTIVDTLSSIIEYRSVETGAHIFRIRGLTKLLAEEVMRTCPEYQLTERQVAILSSAAALHDIGKIAVPDAILLKPGPLTDQEWDVMKTHSVTGCRILETLGDMGDREYLRFAHNICHYHHERWDGKGYPEGLAGEDIPICAQVVGLADAYEALTSPRVYKDAYSCDRAMNMILHGECGIFSPKLLECFKNVSMQFEDLCMQYADGQPGSNQEDFHLPTPSDQLLSEPSGMDQLRSKYYALVHHIGGFLVEINLDRELFHVVYNPYPELARMEGVVTLENLYHMIVEQMVTPEDREHVRWLVQEWVHDFVDEGLRRSTHHFHYQSTAGEPEGLMEFTLLRIGVPKRRSLAILLRKQPQVGEASRPKIQHAADDSHLICRNDQHFTLVKLLREDGLHWGYTVQEIWDLFDGHMDAIIHPEDRSWMRETFSRQLQAGTKVKADHRVILKSGELRWVTAKGRLLKGEDGYEHLHCTLTDITDARTDLEALEARTAHYKDILAMTQTVLFLWDLSSDLLTVSESWAALFPFAPPRAGIAHYLAQASHIHPDDTPLILDKLAALEKGSDAEVLEMRVAIGQGLYQWCRFQAHASRDPNGKLLQVQGTITNADQEKLAAKALKDKADRDSLTKLLNKEAGRRQIEEYLSHYPNGANCALLIIDLDHFKEVNDTYGHLFGDAVLTKVADEIRTQFRGQDIMCRIGGDEFLVLARGLSDREVLSMRCRQFIDSLGMDLRGQDKQLPLSCSIGIALSPDHGTSYIDLFSHADQALYQAKDNGRNDFRFYENQEGTYSANRGARATAVSSRIDSDEEPGLAGESLILQVLHRLYTIPDPNQGIQEVISLLGQATNVSRVYIFENSEDDTYCTNTFEWCNEGIAPEIHNLQRVSYETDIPNYQDNFNEQGVFYCPDVRTLPPAAYAVVEPQGIQSMLHCAICQNGRFKGYIGFDECVEQRYWTKEEINMLTSFSLVLTYFLLKHREQERETGTPRPLPES